ncbi:CocE/NonD family hydrolase [Gemmatimonadota bacterium]
MSRSRVFYSLLRRIGIGLGALVGVLAVLVLIGIGFAPDYTRKMTPAGFPVSSMTYVALDSQTNIWVSAWLPEELQPDETVPTIIETSRYLEEMDPGWLHKAMQTYRLQPDLNYGSVSAFTMRGYAFVRIQSPGSCQSSGPRLIEYPPNEVDAIAAALDWIVQQPWSNGRVGAWGGSYSGTTAEVSSATRHPALRAVYAVAPDFDPYTVIRPGGLGSSEFIHAWAGMIQAMDLNDINALIALSEGVEKLSFGQKLLYRSLLRGQRKPTDQGDIEIFHQAIRDHRENERLYTYLEEIEYKDQTMPGFEYSVEDVAMYNYREAIEEGAVSTYTRAGWLDAEVAKGVLQKYLTIDSPQKIVIGPTGHRLSNIVDLFGEEGRSPGFEGAPADICEDIYEYFERHLREGSEEREPRRILYFTYGVNEWNLTTTWPPEGVTNQTWYFASDNTLVSDNPRNREGSDHYTVDFTTTTGEQNRWMAQMGNPVHYGDRRSEDAMLLVYTSTPLEADLEMTGSPTVRFYVSSDHDDGAFYVYLEDVSPDGRVTYLTEGMLRAVHWKEKDPTQASFVPLGIYHTFREDDAVPLVPGEVTEIGITLLPFSTVFRAGHAIRVAIAGYDMSMAHRCPPEGTPVITVERNAAYPSRLILPVVTRER